MHPAREYLSQLMAELDDQMGEDRPRLMALQAFIVAAGGVPSPPPLPSPFRRLSLASADIDPGEAGASLPGGSASLPPLRRSSLGNKLEGIANSTVEPSSPEEAYGLMNFLLNKANAKVRSAQRGPPTDVGPTFRFFVAPIAREVSRLRRFDVLRLCEDLCGKLFA